MTLFEIILLISIIIALVIIILPTKNKWVGLLFAVLSAIAIPINLAMDGFRWQIVLLYVISMGILIASIVKFGKKPEKKHIIKSNILRRLAIIFTIAILLFSALLPIALPIVDLPSPKGVYSVGTTSLKLTDNDRQELFTRDSEDIRDILINVWYPADDVDTIKAAMYWDKDGVIGEAYSINSGMGPFWYTHLSTVETNSYGNVPISLDEVNYPVIIYSPSFYGLNRENTMIFEELASQGYIVFSVNHSYETIISLFPDGKAVRGSLDVAFEAYDTNTEKEEQLYEDYYMTKDSNKKKEILLEILGVDESSEFLVSERTLDVLFLLDEMDKLNNKDNLLGSKIDLSRIGIMGWSFGGATAMEASMSDIRIKACINIDGWPYGELFNSGKTISQPFMVIRSESDDEMEDMVNVLIKERMNSESYMFEIKGAQHTNFWDFPLFFNVYKYLDYWGHIDALRMKEIESKYILSFFDKYLNNEDVYIDSLTGNYPEVTFIN